MFLNRQTCSCDRGFVCQRGDEFKFRPAIALYAWKGQIISSLFRVEEEYLTTCVVILRLPVLTCCVVSNVNGERRTCRVSDSHDSTEHGFAQRFQLFRAMFLFFCLPISWKQSSWNLGVNKFAGFVVVYWNSWKRLMSSVSRWRIFYYWNRDEQKAHAEQEEEQKNSEAVGTGRPWSPKMECSLNRVLTSKFRSIFERRQLTQLTSLSDGEPPHKISPRAIVFRRNRNPTTARPHPRNTPFILCFQWSRFRQGNQRTKHDEWICSCHYWGYCSTDASKFLNFPSCSARAPALFISVRLGFNIVENSSS